jgi:carbon monoxide dehydrogenase subunit G
MGIHTEAEIKINRPRSEVFDFLSHGEWLPEYIDDFESVTHEEPGEPARGHVYSYKMKRGAEGTFEWNEFQPHDKLAWSGPRVKSGPGSMRPTGYWQLSDEGAGTHVKLVMEPEPGGLFKLMAPLMRMSMAKGNARALEKLKTRLESNGA